MRRLAVLLVVVLSGCPYAVPTPEARVRKGPAATAIVSPLAPLPIACTDVGRYCNEIHMIAVQVQTRMELELAGYVVIDSELINTEVQKRTTVVRDDEPDGPPDHLDAPDPYSPQAPIDTEQIDETVAGARWVDLAPQDQKALLVSIGAQGLLSTRVTFGMPRGLANQQTVTVEIAITRAADDVLAWAARCSSETGDYNSAERALEIATRCALESTTLW